MSVIIINIIVIIIIIIIIVIIIIIIIISSSSSSSITSLHSVVNISTHCSFHDLLRHMDGHQMPTKLFSPP